GCLAALDLFRRTVGCRLVQAKADRSAVRCGELDADEGDMLRAVGVRNNQDRLGSELAVNDLAVMERLERLADPAGDAQGSGRKERAARIEDFTDRGPLRPFAAPEHLTLTHLITFV